MKTFKYDEVYRNEYRNLNDALSSTGQLLEVVYNQPRPHSALGYQPPAELKRACHEASVITSKPAICDHLKTVNEA